MKIQDHYRRGFPDLAQHERNAGWPNRDYTEESEQRGNLEVPAQGQFVWSISAQALKTF